MDSRVAPYQRAKENVKYFFSAWFSDHSKKWSAMKELLNDI